MVLVTDLRPGAAFEFDGQPFLVIKYTHTALGRKKARVKLRIKNLKTNAVLVKTFLSDKKLREIELEKRRLIFLYFDGREYHFKEEPSGKEFEIKKETAFKEGRFLKKNQEIEALFWDEDFLSIVLPNVLSFRVKETGPGIRGNSTSNSYKPAVLDNGLKIKVPLFINIDDVIKVDTKDAKYVERVS